MHACMQPSCSSLVKEALPLQVLFSLVVTQLDERVLPLVEAQLASLSDARWDELLGLLRDANPAGGERQPHTYPRSAIASQFNERLLTRYLRDEAPKRDVRFYQLFVATTPPAQRPRYVLGVLSVQRHALDALLLDSLPCLENLRQLNLYFRYCRQLTNLEPLSALRGLQNLHELTLDFSGCPERYGSVAVREEGREEARDGGRPHWATRS